MEKFSEMGVAGGSIRHGKPGYGVVVEPQLKRRALQQLLTSPRRAVTKACGWLKSFLRPVFAEESSGN